jgi:hypothetical protein
MCGVRPGSNRRPPPGCWKLRLLAGLVAAAASVLLPAGRCLAWIYPEHRDITVLAVGELDPERRSTIDGLWAEARAGREARLCASTAEVGQGEEPTCFDWAAWPAVAGDHSCSGAQLVQTILDEDWILEVAAVSAHLKQELASHKSGSRRVNALLRSDLKLQRTDPEYATRASANNVHFLLARPSVDIARADYFGISLTAGAEPNAVGAYAWYHLSALMKATRLAREPAGTPARAALARAVLADEAFALHFLEDAFSAGHVAGTWGPAAVRKGTHDYYNEHGLDTRTWSGAEDVLAGDANMRPADAVRAAQAVRVSVGQIADAARGQIAIPTDDVAAAPSPEPLDVCQIEAMPARPPAPAAAALGEPIVAALPVPALSKGLGAVPRFRSELGLFIGLAAGASTLYVNGGFGADQTAGGLMGDLEMGLRLGYGLEGVIGEAGDGLVFIELALRQDSASTMPFTTEEDVAQGGAFTAAIPGRGAVVIRVRAPFWLVPGDLLLAAAAVAPFSRRTFAALAAEASNGGLVPWQVGLATPIGRFQFVLGREVAISFYGYTSQRDRVLMPPVEVGASARLVAMRSISFDFPIVEYRPFRSFSLDQTSVLALQIVGGFDTPNHATLIAPEGAPLPEVRTIYTIGLRLAFDWRHY